MAQVRSNNTKPEKLLRSLLFRQGFRFRKNVKNLPGRPDIVFPKYKTVIFVHGCFWHGHTCEAGKLPRSNLSYWQVKIHGNKLRDRHAIRQLKKLGWSVIVVWECRLKNKPALTKTIENLSVQIKVIKYA